MRDPTNDRRTNGSLQWLLGVLLILASGLVIFGQSNDHPGQKSGSVELTDMSLEELMSLTVRSAALHTQKLEDAPALVTVVTEEQIRKNGYRTLAEALADVRGFYVTSDSELFSVGVRGFSLPGDYNTRLLVLINGHNMTDNVNGAMYLFGKDFGLNMDLVKKIEIVRGPSSALYGTNGIFATINVVTRSPEESDGLQGSVDSSNPGTNQTSLSSSINLGHGAHLLTSITGFRSSGRTIEVPEYGKTGEVGAGHGYDAFANLTWHNWNFVAKFSERKITAPAGLYGTIFGDTNVGQTDSHNFVDATWNREIGREKSLSWRVYYDQYRYSGRWDFPLENGVVEDYRDQAAGDWIGSELVYRTSLKRFGSLTVGTQGQVDVRNLQLSYDVAPEYVPLLDASHRDRSVGVFAQQEWSFRKGWNLYAGVRLDDSAAGSVSVSPRLALVHKRSDTVTYKVLYGRSFRNPSAYERYKQPTPLTEEKINTFEVAREQKINNRVDLIASVFHYRLTGLIQGVTLDDGTFRYQNLSDAHATGVELELTGRPTDWLHTSASLTLQKTTSTGVAATANSPGRLAQFRVDVPLAKGLLNLGSSIRYMSARRTMYDSFVKPVGLVDVTATTNHLNRNFDLQLGVRNLANRIYSDPLATQHLLHSVPQEGRTAFVKLMWHGWRADH